MADPTEKSVDARAAGRGGVAVLFAKIFFLGVGFVQQALLPRAIGLAGYGAFSRVFAAASILSNVVVFSSTQGVSRAVAGAGEKSREAFRAALRVHAVIGLGTALAFAALSPYVARFQGAPHIARPLLVMAALLFVYGIYAPLIGYLNGRGQFQKQAMLDVTAAALRTLGLLGVGLLFQRGMSEGVLGATIGAVSAASMVCVIALVWTGTGASSTAPDPRIPTARAYLLGLVPVILAQLFTNGLMQADISILGRFLSESAQAQAAAQAHAAGLPPEKLADEWVGVYRACQLFAFLPYQLLFSVTQVLFPMLAKAHGEGDRPAIARLVSRGARLGAIVCGLFLSVVVALPSSLLKFAYGADMAARGEGSLRILALGQGAFALLGLATTVLVSLKRERHAMALTFSALLLTLNACWFTIQGHAFGEAQLRAAALATTGSLGCALAVGVVVVRRDAGAFVPLATALRVGLAIALFGLLGRFVPTLPEWLTPGAALLVALGYALILVVTRELGSGDLALVQSVISKRREPKP